MALGMTPYLMFDGTARDAVTYYASIFGGETELLTYEEGMNEQGEARDRIMHSSVYLERGAQIMAADVFPGQQSNGLGTLALSASEDDPEENSRIVGWWHQLLPESEVVVPLDAAPWDPSSKYGQLKDQFGVEWMFLVAATD
ncbi:VOC family protein [Nesterenkonia salmonea]|uniref:VOC family protein n=1 Tax=Nesterenkonia salmonea TaxID=1804987 RepID=A0A5R9BAZ0_9MICC|nr:VOC family protein [Nesterenkonia salmonea]TLP97413.1 VOC family protein [Nesterenkonia salmonea]